MYFTGLGNLGLSVVIVTLNGKHRLNNTLEYLANQKDVNFLWEVLVIDNNSTDDTVDFVERKWFELGTNVELRILKELQPGTMYARQKGIFESNYRYLLFCDDDNWLNEYYLKHAFNSIISDESIAGVGGRGIAKYETEKLPNWLDSVSRYLGCGPQGKTSGDITNGKGCLYTAGAVFDRKWLYKLYSEGFRSKLKGRDGDSLVAGEDTELTYALVRKGARLSYSDEMWFYHYIPKNRTEWNYFLRLFRGIGYSDYVLQINYKNKSNKTKDLIITSLLIIKYFSISIFTIESEGNSSLLSLSMLKGRLKAISTRWYDVNK